MRVLPGVTDATFDVSSEVFTVKTTGGTTADSVLAVIRDLGFQPTLLEGPAPATAPRTTLRDPTSRALREALARAQERGVPLVADFGATWCGPCKQFATTTLTDPRVIKALADFEFLAIDIDDDPAAARDLGVAGVPDIWFVAPNGTVLGRENRFLDADAFLTALAAAR